MNHQSEAKIRKEIRRRAFERADFVRRKRQNRQKTRFTLDALQEVTGLPRSELDLIAKEVKLSHDSTRDGFFSIRNQILWAFCISGFVMISSSFLFIR